MIMPLEQRPEVVPKVILPAGPVARWTGAAAATASEPPETSELIPMPESATAGCRQSFPW